MVALGGGAFSYERGTPVNYDNGSNVLEAAGHRDVQSTWVKTPSATLQVRPVSKAYTTLKAEGFVTCCPLWTPKVYDPTS